MINEQATKNAIPVLTGQEGSVCEIAKNTNENSKTEAEMMRPSTNPDRVPAEIGTGHQENSRSTLVVSWFSVSDEASFERR